MLLVWSLLLIPGSCHSFLTASPSNFYDAQYFKLSKLVKEFRNNDKILVTDNFTVTYLDKFISTFTSITRGLVLINMDTNIIPLPPKDNNYMHVVILKNVSKYEALKDHKKNLLKTGIIFVISENMKRQNICSLKNLTVCPKFVYSLTTSNLYICQHGSAAKSKILHYDTNLKSKNIFAAIQIVRYKYYYNFGGETLVVGFENQPPSISVKNQSGVLQVDGIDYKLLDALSKQLNFKYTLKQFKRYNLTGAKSLALKSAITPGSKFILSFKVDKGKNKALTLLCNVLVTAFYMNPKMTYTVQLIRNKVDVVLGGLTLTIDRATFFNFITPYQSSFFMAFYLKSTDNFPTISDLVWNKLFKTYYIPLLMFSTVFIGCVLKISTIIFKEKNMRAPRYVGVVFNILIGLSDPLLTIYNKIPYRTSIKFVLLFWLIMKVTIEVYFSAIFRSHIMCGRNTNDNVMDLIKKGYTFVLNPNDHDYINNWCYNSTLLLCNFFTAGITYSDDRCESLMKKKHAIVMENFPSFAFLKALYDFLKNMKMEENVSNCTFMKLPNVAVDYTEVFIGEGWQTFLVSKTSPYEPAFSYTTLRLLEAGIVQYWVSFELIIIQKIKELTKNQSAPAVIKLEKLLFVFEIWLVGILCSILVFLEEKRRFHYNKKHNR